MRWSWLCCVLLIGACASGRYIHLPDGSRGRMVECSGAERDWGDCMNRAHRVCDGRYRIVERYSERGGGALAARDTGSPTWAASRERKMLIACGP